MSDYNHNVQCYVNIYKPGWGAQAKSEMERLLHGWCRSRSGSDCQYDHRHSHHIQDDHQHRHHIQDDNHHSHHMQTLPKALRTQALTALTSNFGLVGLVQYAW